jgi:hypothetical protein
MSSLFISLADVLKTLQSYKKILTYANFRATKCGKNAFFFDYSLWNHYVNVHLPLFLALRQWAVYLIFLSYFSFALSALSALFPVSLLRPWVKPWLFHGFPMV